MSKWACCSVVTAVKCSETVFLLTSLLTCVLSPFLQTVQSHKPHFLAVHCQEVGGKNYEASMSHVDSFVK